MKNLKLIAITAISIFGLACNKPKPHPIEKVATNENLPANEVTYKPASVAEGHKQTMNFLNFTHFGKNKTRSEFPDLDRQVAAWIFESAANYLKNPNDVFMNDLHSYTIDVSKVNATTVDGVDLTNEFNAFVTQINNAQGEIPKIINVYFLGDQADKVTFKIDVYHGDEPLSAVVFPTTDVNYCLATDYLRQGIQDYIHQQYIQFSQQCQCAYYFNSIYEAPIPLTVGGGYAQQGDGFYEYKLWRSSVVNNGILMGLFHSADFVPYFDNLKDIANQSPNDVVSSNLIQLGIGCENVTSPPPFFPGFQHKITKKVYGAYVPVTNQ